MMAKRRQDLKERAKHINQVERPGNISDHEQRSAPGTLGH